MTGSWNGQPCAVPRLPERVGPADRAAVAADAGAAS